MAFNVNEFNNRGIRVNVQENFGNMKFVGLEKRQIFKDNQPTDEFEVTHAIFYSEKIGDNLQVKLEEGKTYQEVPFMSDVVIDGDVSIYIYNFDNVVGFGDNRQEITDYGFSIRVSGYHVIGSSQGKKEQKQEQHG